MLPNEEDQPVIFREIEPSYRDKLVQMHEELFPVSYSQRFYDLAVQKTGLRGGDLFTSIAFQKRNGIEEMVGFVMSQFLSIRHCEERHELFDEYAEPKLVYYILTLGVERGMRRTGLGTDLLNQCIEHACGDDTCGAVYLHVINYNKPALRFYHKNGFLSVAEYPGFYNIHNRRYTSELCSLYINGFRPPLWRRMQEYLRSQSTNIIHWFKHLLKFDITLQDEEKEEPYMEDFVLPSDDNNLTVLTKKSQVEFPVTITHDDIPPGFESKSQEYPNKDDTSSSNRLHFSVV